MNIDNRIIAFYKDYCEKNGVKVSRDSLRSSIELVLEDLYEYFWILSYRNAFKSCGYRMMDIDSSNFEADSMIYIEGEQNKFVAEVVKKASIFLFINSEEVADDLLNEIFSKPIETIVEEFRMRTKFAYSVFLYYMEYAVDSHYSFITPQDEARIIELYPFIDDIPTNRGFFTISDLARKVLFTMCELFMNCSLDIDQVNWSLDSYFQDASSDRILKKFAKLYTADKSHIEIFKKYQERIILMDSYLYLKTSFLEHGSDTTQEENLLLDLLIRKFKNGDYRLPKDKRWRYSIYQIFQESLFINFSSEKKKKVLDDNEDAHIIKMGNPLYFLDN